MTDDSTAETDVERWAREHGFAPSERKLRGETPLLREGMMDVATDVFEGELDGRPVVVFDLYVDAPGLPVPGESGVNTTSFTVLLVEVSAPRWPRITVHPAEFSEGGWLARIVRRDDRRVRHVGAEFDRRYRMRVANSIPDDDVDALLESDFVSWCLDQPALIFDLENNVDTGDSLVVAAPGTDAGAETLDRLREQARSLAERFEAGG